MKNPDLFLRFLLVILATVASSHLVKTSNVFIVLAIFQSLANFIDYFTTNSTASNATASPLPPGPYRFPLIGNLHQAPTKRPWLVFQQWTKQYGPFYMLKFGVNTIMMIGDYATARNLLDKKGNIYSSRPHLTMAGDHVVRGLYPALIPYGPEYRMHQRLQAFFLNATASQSYRPLQDLESKQAVFDLLSSNAYKKHTRRYGTSLVFALLYGRRLESADDQEVRDFERIGANFVYATRPGNWVVDSIPVLKYLPGFLTPWKRWANEQYYFEEALHTRNMNFALQPTTPWNWCKQLLTTSIGQNMSRLGLAYSVGMVLNAAGNNNSHTMQFFLVAAVLHPEIIEEAHKEIDRVVGTNRLPDFADKKNLPYIEAIICETLRWLPVITTGIPHSVQEDDVYEGVRIPKDTMIIASHYTLLRDPAIYTSPDLFQPQRWLSNPSLPMPAFGWGRRACPGNHIARDALFILIARLIWAFEMEAVGEKPDPDRVLQEYSSAPVEFKMRFKIREGRDEIVKREWDLVEKDIGVLLEDVRIAQSTSKKERTT